MTINASSKLSKLQRLYEFEKSSKEPALSIGKIANYSTATVEDTDLLAWELFVDCCLNKIEYKAVRPIATFEQDLLSSITETTPPNPVFSSAYRHYEEYSLRTDFFISKAAYYYWAKNSKYWSELKDNDFFCCWLKDIIIEDESICAWLKVELAKVEQQPGGENSCDDQENTLNTKQFDNTDPENISTGIDSITISNSENIIIENSIKLNGEVWELSYKGETKLIKNYQGIRYITYLLQNKNKEFSASNLEQAVNPPELQPENASKLLLMSPEELNDYGVDTCDFANPEQIYDEKAMASIAEYCLKIKDEMVELRSMGDDDGVEELISKLDNINKQINKDKNHLGKSRTMPDETTKEINRISTAISRAIKKVSKDFEELGSHLNKEIKKGAYFSYKPDSTINWTLLK